MRVRDRSSMRAEMMAVGLPAYFSDAWMRFTPRTACPPDNRHHKLHRTRGLGRVSQGVAGINTVLMCINVIKRKQRAER